MVKIGFQSFDGEFPRMDPHYLPDNAAAEARNVKLTGGTLRPLRAPVTTLTYTTGGGRDSVAFHKGEWLSWFQDADAVPGPVADDRLYITRASDTPRFNVGGVNYALVLEAPTAKPTVTRSGTYDEALAERVVYAFTNVTIFGEETAPSPLSDFIMFSPGTTITVGNLPNRTDYGGRPLLHSRIYRSQTTASGATELFFIGTAAPNQTSFADVFGARPLAEPIPSVDFAPVPAALRGLTAMPNGIMAGFVGKEVMFCEPFMPHAWPFKYRLTMNDEVVGLAAIGTSLVVLTTGMPYIVQGLHPEQMSMAKMEVGYPCISKRSIVDMGHSAIYASHLGLVQITEGGGTLISEQLWTEEEWVALGPETIRAARWGEVYAFTHTPVATNIRIVTMVNTRGDKPALVRSDVRARTLYTHPENGSLYMLSANGLELQRFDSGAALPMLWKSKRFRFPHPVSFSAFLIERAEAAESTRDSTAPIVLYQDELIGFADNVTVVSQTEQTATMSFADALLIAETDYTARINLSGTIVPESWVLDIYAEGRIIHTATNGSGTICRPPAGEYRDWQFVIKGTDPILSLALGQSAAEVGA